MVLLQDIESIEQSADARLHAQVRYPDFNVKTIMHVSKIYFDIVEEVNERKQFIDKTTRELDRLFGPTWLAILQEGDA